jgi:hypothetical protein
MGEGERRENKEQVQEASCPCPVPDDAGTVNATWHVQVSHAVTAWIFMFGTSSKKGLSATRAVAKRGSRDYRQARSTSDTS